MKTLILYYSRTGNTGKVAQALQQALGADLCQIDCPRYRPGGLRYLLAGYDSLRGRLPQIDLPDVAIADFDLVLLGAPVWTSYPATPLRALLATTPQFTGQVGLFMTLGGHSEPQKAFDGVAEHLSMPLIATLAVPQSAVEQDGFADQISAFTEKLTDRAGPDLPHTNAPAP